MGLLVFPPHFSSFFPLPKNPSTSRRTRFHCSSCIPIRMEAMGRTGSSAGENGGTAVLWFKHDLRIDDHPGLVAAASRHRTIVPLYVFDRRILSRCSDEMLELIIFAVEDLRKSLKDQGSELMVRFGHAEKIMEELVKKVKANYVYAEEVVEYDLCRIMDLVKETLKTVSFPEGSPEIVLWNTPFYHIKDLNDLPASHDELKKQRFPVLSPILPPKLPDLDLDLTWGSLPTLDDLRTFLSENPCTLKFNWSSIKESSTEIVLQNGQAVSSSYLTEGSGLLEPVESNQNNSNNKHAEFKRPIKSAFVTHNGSVVSGGTSVVMNALAAYLRYSEGSVRDDWQEVHEKLRNSESREGASFGALFRSALCLGIISRRRVHYEAIKYEKERNAGFLSPFGYSASSVAAAVDTVCSIEWYWLMASKCQMTDVGSYSIRFWRWNGYLIHYRVAGHEGPATVLVHGFGAFAEHYRDNINGIAEGGNRVWAITLLGFGRSEKPNIMYTELLWAQLLRDFITEVVGEPVHLVGNSLGGYFVAIVAGLWPAIAKSIVLINSAGNIVPGCSSATFSKKRQTSGAATLSAKLLLICLRLILRNFVKNCYPSKTKRADDWLINEMTRASYDPGVAVVLESIFSLNLSLPLNYLLEGMEGKVLVVQGMKDPLSDSKSKLAMFRDHCKGIAMKELDAGHSPQDERPDEVNSIIREWVVAVERNISMNRQNAEEKIRHA